MPVSRPVVVLAAVAALALTASASPAGAQDAPLSGCDPDGPTPAFLSAANEVYYGCGAIFRSTPPQYFSAIGRFRNATAAEPRNAVAHFLLGAAYLGYGQADSARAALTRALALDASVMQRLAPRLAERPELRARLDGLLGTPATPTTPATPAGAMPAAPATPAAAAPPAAPPARPAAAFEPGDAVEVRSAGSDWEPGVVVAVEDDRGDGSRYLYQVRHEVVRGAPATATVSRIWPADIRAARGTAAPAAAAAPAGAAELVSGSYACTHDVWSGPPAARQRVSTPKGSLLLRADGTYRYLDNGGVGRYRYDRATRAIQWTTGPLAAMRPERTTFRRNLRTAQVDIRQRGDYEWSCGIDLP